MGSFSIWHWLVVLLVLGGVAAIVVVAFRSSRRADPGELRGFGGWLLLLAIGVCLGPLRSLVNLVTDQQDMPPAVRERFPVMVNGEIVLMVAFILLQVAVAVQMLCRRASFSRWFVALFAGVCLLVPLDVFWVAGSLRAQVGQGFAETLGVAVTPDLVVRYVAAVIGVGLWTLYVTRSRRVANTFVNGRR